MRTSILALALVLLTAGFAYADEVILNDGDVLEGDIQKVDHTGVTLVTGDKTIEIEPAMLDAHDYYELWAKRVEKNAEAHLRLAVYAYENGLFNQARSQYRKAKHLDAERVKEFEKTDIPRIKEGVADQLLKQVQAAVEKKDWHLAERIAAKILTQLDDTKAAEKAREILASVHLWQLNADEERMVKNLRRHLPKDEAKAIEEQARILKKLEPIQRKVDKAREQVTRGLRTKGTNRQKGIFESAAKSFESAVGSLDKLLADAGEDQALAAHVGELRTIAVREGIEAYVNAGNVYLIRRSYDKALGVADKALALDPNSPVAKQFQRRVLHGSQMRGGWWGRGR